MKSQFLKGLAIVIAAWGTLFTLAFTYGVKSAPVIDVNEENIYWYKAEVESVYDGDSYTCMVAMGMGVYKTTKVRSWGINTPEVRGDSKIEGLKVRDSVRNRILNKTVYIKTRKDKKGKYGRYLCEVFYIRNNALININKQLVDEGFAVEYMMGNDDFSTSKILE
jgi:micrococcal nuclease